MFLGRDFLPEEDQPGKNHVVILSNRLWSQHFGADRDLDRQRHPDEWRTLHGRRRPAAGHA